MHEFYCIMLCELWISLFYFYIRWPTSPFFRNVPCFLYFFFPLCVWTYLWSGQTEGNVRHEKKQMCIVSVRTLNKNMLLNILCCFFSWLFFTLLIRVASQLISLCAVLTSCGQMCLHTQISLNEKYCRNKHISFRFKSWRAENAWTGLNQAG